MWWKVIAIWCLLVSIYGFVMMGLDKRKAIQLKRRISERHFYQIVALGGFLGVSMGMFVWRHKTQKWKFKLPVFGIFTMQILGVIIFYLLYSA
jgi:uncharacterized membrane protein YsdA (DUF1294 family)